MATTIKWLRTERLLSTKVPLISKVLLVIKSILARRSARRRECHQRPGVPWLGQRREITAKVLAPIAVHPLYHWWSKPLTTIIIAYLRHRSHIWERAEHLIATIRQAEG